MSVRFLLDAAIPDLAFVIGVHSSLHVLRAHLLCRALPDAPVDLLPVRLSLRAVNLGIVVG